MWKEATDSFSEEERHYNGKYLLIDHVLDGKIEVSLFSSDDDWEIYFSFGIMHGIVYVDKDNALKRFGEIKNDIEREYKKNTKPTSEFIDYFDNKYGICLPNDLYFNLF